MQVAEPRPQYTLEEALKVGQLKTLLQSDLSFAGEDTGYGLHSLHAFAAKFPPQLPRLFIENLTKPGNPVCDPMSGSGTALLEASYLGRPAIGVDLDPLAIKIAQAKGSVLSSPAITAALADILSYAEPLPFSLLDLCLTERFTKKTQDFIVYWFTPQISHQLMALALAIERIEDRPLRNFFDVVFSSIVVTKSGGVSRARDLAHTRPHRVDSKRIPDAFIEFRKRTIKARTAFESNHKRKAEFSVIQGDTRQLPLRNETIDLIVTSPPYANAIDYMRAHKFSLVWLGYPIEALSEHRRTYIGYETAEKTLFASTPLVAQTVAKVAAAGDIHRANTLSQYFADMALAVSEMYRVLRSGKAAIVVVGSSTIRNMPVPTHLCIAEIMEKAGFEVVGVVARALDRDRRLMPASRENGNGEGIEKRMHSEFVIGAVKV